MPSWSGSRTQQPHCITRVGACVRACVRALVRVSRARVHVSRASSACNVPSCSATHVKASVGELALRRRYRVDAWLLTPSMIAHILVQGMYQVGAPARPSASAAASPQHARQAAPMKPCKRPFRPRLHSAPPYPTPSQQHSIASRPAPPRPFTRRPAGSLPLWRQPEPSARASQVL